ncbi:hypothetical protein VTH06DRAFT_4629 [Thermothelomyces fergusii]
MRDANSLRLRLVVQRHALPEVRVVFAVSLDNDPTISSLLEQVNDIIPLESSDWGLEDYTVQLRDPTGHAFDCLHFQQVSAILNNDEVVYIRALDTNDRRKRRLAGRDQISRDGKHLIDGVAFGRPRLKTPRDRPPVDIPPLKRRRLTYGDDSDEDDQPRLLLTEHGENQTAGRRVRIRAPDDAEGEGSDGDEEDADGDFTDETDGDEADVGSDDDIGNSELEDELRDLQADNEQLQERPPNAKEDMANAAQPSAPGQFVGLDLQTLDKISALRAAFPTAQFDACERALTRRKGDAKSAYSYLRAQHEPLMSLDAMLSRLNAPASRAAATAHDTSGESEAESVASIVKHYDQHGFPSGSVLKGTAAAQMAKAMRKSGLAVKSPVHTRFDDESHVQARQELPPDSSAKQHELEGSDESRSGQDSESDSGPEVASSKLPPETGGDQVKSSRVDRDSDNKSGDESEEQGKPDPSESDKVDSDEESNGESSEESSDDSSDDSASDDADSDLSEDTDGRKLSSEESSDSDSSSDDESSDSSVGGAFKALTAQKEDNTAIQTSAPSSVSFEKPRSEDACRAGETASAGPPKPVPPGQGKTATQKRNARRRAARAAQRAAARGEQSISTGDLEAASAPKDQCLSDPVAAKKAALLQKLGMSQGASADHGTESVVARENGENNSQSSSAAKDSSVFDVTSKKQMDSSARRTPPQESNRQASGKTVKEGDSEAWRNKIVYRAVECCQDGVELSEPPFPFVQRWDPQQQYIRGDKRNRGGRSKRKQRDQQEYLDQSSRPSTKKRKYSNDSLDPAAHHGNDKSYTDYDGVSGFDDTILNYDDDNGSRPEKEEPSAQSAEDQSDLPPLPADVSALPTLEPGKAVPGMILTWKQWLLSKATNWQPQVSSLTGIVVNVPDDNIIEVRLAKRDRNLDGNEKVYDEDGNRIYDKFELPDLDDEGDDAAEQGYRTMNFADLIEPRILQYANKGADSSPRLEQPSNSTTELPEPPGSTPNLKPVCTNASVSPKEAVPEKNEAEGRQEENDIRQGGDQSAAHESSAVPEPSDYSISEDRRHEISLLIHDAGFRKDVDPSVTDNKTLDLNSPSQRLEKVAHDVALPSDVSEGQGGASTRRPSQSTSNNVESQPTVVLEPFHGFSDCTSEAADEYSVAQRNLDRLTSEPGSLGSGRQIDPDFSIEVGENPIHDPDDPPTNSPSTLGRQNEDRNRWGNKVCDSHVQDDSDSSSSDSSLPSLSDVWKARATKSPKARCNSAAMFTTKMTKTDDASLPAQDGGGESWSKQGQRRHGKANIKKPASKTPRKLSEKKGESKSASPPLVKTEGVSPNPAPVARGSFSKTKRENSSQSVRGGSQASAVLLSNSSESELEEYYAEDSIDETYEEPDLPTGPGWVKKTRARRGASVPATSTAREAAPSRLSSSQPLQSPDKRTTAALNSLLRARKRALSRNMA